MTRKRKASKNQSTLPLERISAHARASVMRGLAQARSLKFSESPDLAKGAELVKQIEKRGSHG